MTERHGPNALREDRLRGRRGRLTLAATAVVFATVPALARIPIHGTVLAERGRPVASAEVKLLPILDAYEAGRLLVLAGRDEPEPAAVATSDAGGRFRFVAPAAGAFKVAVSVDGFLPMRYQPFVAVEETVLPPLVLRPSSPMTVRVVSAAGEPLEGIRVVAIDPARPTAGWLPALRSGTTGADGEVVLARSADEALDVSAFPPGTLGATVSGVRDGQTVLRLETSRPGRLIEVRGTGGEALAEALVRAGALSWPLGLTDRDGRITVPADGRHPVVVLTADSRFRSELMPAAATNDPVPYQVVLPEPVTLTGRVLDAAAGVPLAGALVWTGVDPGGFVHTDAGGRYRVAAPPLSGERFWVQAEAAGYLPRATWVTRTSGVDRLPTLALERGVALAGRVLDAAGGPVAGAELEALPRGRPTFFRADPVASRSGSGPEGRFSLAGLRAGAPYELRAHHPDLAPRRLEAFAPEPPRAAAELTVVLPRRRPAFGRVLDLEDKPVTGAEVSARDATETRPPRTPPWGPADAEDPFRSQSDTEGRFRMDALPAAEVDLRVRKEGYSELIVRGVEAPAGDGPVDLGTFILAPGARLAGRVVDPEGEPIGGAAVLRLKTVVSRDHVNEERLRRLDPHAVADAEGRFALEDLVPGEKLSLFVYRSGYGAAWLPGVEVPEAPTSKPLFVELEPARTMRGRVLGEDGQPIPEAEVSLEWHANIPLIRGRRQVGAPIYKKTRTDPEGRFALHDLRPGTAQLEARASGFVTGEPRDVEIPEEGDVENLVFTLRRGAVVEGRVLTTEGEPVEGAVVAMTGSHSRTDFDGAYQLDGVAIGEVVASAMHPGYGRVNETIEIVSERQTVDLTFAAGHQVAGRVVDAAGSPIADAVVRLLKNDFGLRLSYHGRTAADGSFALTPVADGVYRAQAAKPGHAPGELDAPVTVDGRDVEALEIVLEPGKTIFGQVIGLEDDELTRLTVAARNDEGDSVDGRIDYRGRYEIADLGAGDWLLEAVLDGGEREVQARVHLASGASRARRDLEFRDLFDLSGEVLYDGEPLAGTTVSLAGVEAAVEREVLTDFEGAFHVADLEPGPYRLSLVSSRKLLVHNEMLRLDGDREVRFELGTASLSGFVVDAASRRPVADALVMLRHLTELEGEVEFLVTGGSDADGFFELPRVPAGRYRLSGRRDGYAESDEVLEVRAGADVRGLEIALAATGGLDLEVRLASGRIPSSVDVQVVAANGRPLIRESRPVDAEGRARLATVPPGTWEVWVSAPGGALTGIRARVPGEPQRVVLPDAGRLTVRVPGLAGSELYATVAVHDAAGRALRAMDTYGTILREWPLAGGRAVIDGVPAGVWAVVVTAPDGRSWESVVTTSGTAAAEVRLE